METLELTFSQLKRFKNSIPFSERLNYWLKDRVKDITFHVTDSDNYDTFEKIQRYYERTGAVIVWSGSSNSTIYGNEKTNILARVWHDYLHIKNGLTFDAIDEIKVSALQVAELPESWKLERELIHADISGQVLYFHENGEFPRDQRKFVLNFLSNGKLFKQL